jgi:hypothetical protein
VVSELVAAALFAFEFAAGAGFALLGAAFAVAAAIHVHAHTPRWRLAFCTLVALVLLCCVCGMRRTRVPKWRRMAVASVCDELRACSEKRHDIFGIHAHATAYNGWCPFATGGMSVGKPVQIATACSAGAAVISGDAIKHQACELLLASADLFS